MLEKYHVFPPGKHWKFSHGSTVTYLPDGKIMVAWYAGSAEKAPDVGIYAAVADVDNFEFSEPYLLEKESDSKSEGNPVLYYDSKNDRLWLFWATMDRAGKSFLPGGWSTCKLKYKYSEDGGQTWSEPRYLTRTWGKMTRNKPLRLSNGDVILPIYSEWLGYKANFLIWSADDFDAGRGSVYKKVGPIGGGIMQPTVVEISKGHLSAFNRTVKSGKCGGRIAKLESTDYGRHWDGPECIGLPNPNSACDAVKTSDGKIILAFNNSAESRNPLGIAVSDDNGNTWKYAGDLENEEGQSFAYPALITLPDGRFCCTYTYRGGICIELAVFDKNWLGNSE